MNTKEAGGEQMNTAGDRQTVTGISGTASASGAKRTGPIWSGPRAEGRRGRPPTSSPQNMHGYTHLSFFTAVDRIEGGMFELHYMLHSYGIP